MYVYIYICIMASGQLLAVLSPPCFTVNGPQGYLAHKKQHPPLCTPPAKGWHAWFLAEE